MCDAKFFFFFLFFSFSSFFATRFGDTILTFVAVQDVETSSE